ncbi:hypothetical protein P280DRAFT_485360 [Massarina eburnea CBS 473.64]|uniref:Aminoglycoside phosphotransferase domain-containing protein n=1 Tax=Massarina eburnea CBS 473.64 TaxID=1395130 RepID=A0A6A6RHW4_9PLEO|nr:hypothetical protein P280DRAFT_485360 [Massarina eburnea CBS 473.64]
MHLPPLDVAVYPVVTMSHGRHGSRTNRSLSTISSSSSSSAASMRGCAVAAPDFLSIQRLIQRVFRSSRITVQQAERLQGHHHQVYLARLADGSALVIKCPPNQTTRSLRHEKWGLETERKTLETLHEYTQLPVPQVLKYDGHGGSFGSPYLLKSYIPGRRLSEISPTLSTSERNGIDRTLGAYVRTLTSLNATQFGLTHRVFDKKGSNSWQEAFLALLESALRDAEDMLITMPYESIRGWVNGRSKCLDEVTEPKLVALNVCDPRNVIINEQTKQVSGLVGFSNVIWGDPLLSGGIPDGSDAFFQGFGECPLGTGGHVRQLIYAIYRAVVQIVAHHYRPHSGIDELQARRSLTYALNSLARI